MKKLSLIIFFVIPVITGFSQTGVLKGTIKDKKDEPLYGVNVMISGIDSDFSTGGVTDFDGKFKFELNTGKYNVKFQYIGYQKITEKVSVAEGQVTNLNIVLKKKKEIIEEVVVSAAKYEQKLSEVTVSMEVIKPEMIESTNTNSMDDALNKVPGLEVNDDQPSIRGGGGWSYGAGSRVLVLVNDLPLISADAGDAKWDYLPVENISQIEVLKGASSVLYGSSAMNGVINIRTAYPTEKSKTKIIYNTGFYNEPKNPVRVINGTTYDKRLYTGNNFYNEGQSPVTVPFREEMFYWVNKPMFGGLSFSHQQKFGNFDFVLSGKHYADEGAKVGQFNKRTRMNSNMRFRSKKIEGLAYGVNASFMSVKKSEFLLWRSKTFNQGDSTVIYPYETDTSVLSITEGYRFNIDPFIKFYKKNGSRYSINTRIYQTDNRIPDDTSKNNKGTIYYGEYRYQTDIGKYTKLAAGGVTSYSEVESNLFGNHYSNNLAGYVQLDNNFGSLKTSVGVRAEYYRVDTAQTESMVDVKLGNNEMEIPVKPVFRAGANYKLAEYTNLRASIGQGYRFPSIAEKYTATSLGGMVKVFPNPRLESETGWSAEIGGRQGFKIGKNWTGFADIALYYNRYNNMMEFAVDFIDTVTYEPIPDSMATFENFGFQSQNIGDVNIYGIDLSVSAKGEIYDDLSVNLFAGYTYMHPVNIYENEEEKEKVYTTKNRETDYLKYRFKHNIKANVIFEYKVFSAGMSMRYHSPLLAVDNVFVSPVQDDLLINEIILPGYHNYYAYNKYKPRLTYDTHFGWQMSKHIKSSIVVRNLFNSEYVSRPGKMMPPRSISYQFTAEF